MTTTADLLDQAQQRLGLTSDYQLAKALGWPVGTVSNYRRRIRSMDVGPIAELHSKTGIPLELLVSVAVEEGKRLKSIKRRLPVQTTLGLSSAP